jgi:hypothetical protein
MNHRITRRVVLVGALLAGVSACGSDDTDDAGDGSIPVRHRRVGRPRAVPGGDPTYVTVDEQIVFNLELPLKYVVAGSEAALIETPQTAVADGTPVLVQFWKPTGYTTSSTSPQ